MARTIKRRDPTRPGFWYLSYNHPHPPLVPLQSYLDLYRDAAIDEPYIGDWAARPEALPFFLRAHQQRWEHLTSRQIVGARRAFYALCTHIDHQLRVVIGTLREEGVLDDTIIMFLSDHGDALGNHGLWAKRLLYEGAANIPMLLMPAAGDERVGFGRTDDRLVGLRDVMPTLLDLAGIPIPATVEGLSMIGPDQRDHFYGESSEGADATRMIHDGRFKLIYYPAGNHTQLFDLASDPHERHDLAASTDHTVVRARLTSRLIAELYGSDETWLEGETLVGLPAQTAEPRPNRGLSQQRGHHWPPPPRDDEMTSLL